MVVFLRSLAFHLYFYLWTAIACIVFVPLLFTKPSIARKAGYYWSSGVLWGLKIICGIGYKLEGLEYLPKQGGFILASKHQSAWDTIIFLKLFPGACYILKQELLRIPLFGRYLKAIAMIAVNRKGGASALKDMSKQVQDRLRKNRAVIIFPEGTRTLPGQHGTYHPGIAMLYTDPNILSPIIPVALNSGLFWHKSKFLRPKGTIIVKFLPPISQGLDRKIFLKTLQNTVDSHSDTLPQGN